MTPILTSKKCQQLIGIVKLLRASVFKCQATLLNLGTSVTTQTYWLISIYPCGRAQHPLNSTPWGGCLGLGCGKCLGETLLWNYFTPALHLFRHSLLNSQSPGHCLSSSLSGGKYLSYYFQVQLFLWNMLRNIIELKLAITYNQIRKNSRPCIMVGSCPCARARRFLLWVGHNAAKGTHIYNGGFCSHWWEL
jgi:hypothetical protein